MLVGAKDQKPFGGLLLRNFEETRNEEFSVDRLGRSNVEKSVVNYLRPLADAAGRAFHSRRRFDAWAVLPAHRLGNPTRGVPLPVIASPEENNPYHAHLFTQDLLASERDRHYHIALHLRALFTGSGSSVHTASVQTQLGLLRFAPSWLRQWLSKQFK